jgi:hypothetical protein
MNTKSYSIQTVKPKCIDQKTGSITIIDRSNGLLSFSWTNINTDALIADYGKTVYNLSCGVYTLQIYNLLKKSTETIDIDLSCADALSMDLVHVGDIQCYNDNISMHIEWSGGLAPYILSINNFKINTSQTFYDYIIKPNYYYNISVTDKNGCIAEKKEIRIITKPLSVEIKWEPITQYNGVSSNVSCNITGGVEPYKVAWFKEDVPQPIIVNQTSINYKLVAGDYKLIVTDKNNCEIIRNFTISQPKPISVNVSRFNDYSTKALFDPVEAKVVYNLLLLPLSKSSDYSDILSSEISIKNGNHQIEQKLCMDYGNIVINDQEYQYYYISPGIEAPHFVKSKLLFNDKEINLEHVFGSGRAKLVIGSMIISNDYSFAYKNNDIIKINELSNNSYIDTQIKQVFIKSGLYFSNNISTILNIIHNNTIDIEPILFINKHKNLTTQSLTTKSNNRLGSITCHVSNADKSSLIAILTNEFGDTRTLNFNDKYHLTINNLMYGKYILKIKDNNSSALIYNNEFINTDSFDIEILDSSEKERELSMIQSASTFDIDASLLNVYNKPPNRLLFSDPEFKNGVLLNINPIDACYKIIGQNYTLDDCGYKIIKDLGYGKYSVEIFKKGYVTQNIEFFYNTTKETVTVILDKDKDNA